MSITAITTTATTTAVTTESTTQSSIDSRVTTVDGNVRVSVDLPVNVADQIIAILRANETPALAAVIDTLAGTLNDAYTAVIDEILGCSELLPGGDSLILTEPAILGSADGHTLAVLLPGAYGRLDAATQSLNTIQGYASELGVDMNDPNLTVNIHPASWMMLHPCSSDTHDFHPQGSDAGTPGAILVTRVDLEMGYVLAVA